MRLLRAGGADGTSSVARAESAKILGSLCCERQETVYDVIEDLYTMLIANKWETRLAAAASVLEVTAAAGACERLSLFAAEFRSASRIICSSFTR